MHELQIVSTCIGLLLDSVAVCWLACCRHRTNLQIIVHKIVQQTAGLVKFSDVFNACSTRALYCALRVSCNVEELLLLVRLPPQFCRLAVERNCIQTFIAWHAWLHISNNLPGIKSLMRKKEIHNDSAEHVDDSEAKLQHANGWYWFWMGYRRRKHSNWFSVIFVRTFECTQIQLSVAWWALHTEGICAHEHGHHMRGGQYTAGAGYFTWWARQRHATSGMVWRLWWLHDLDRVVHC